MAEDNFEAWKEIRARADSLATALFLVAGGALSVSIAVLLGKDHPSLSESTKCLVSVSWYLLVYAIAAFVFVKGLLIVQAYKFNTQPPNAGAWQAVTTRLNWLLGASGLVTFVLGMFLLVRAATAALN